MEYWDVYDRNGVFTGRKLLKGSVFGKNEYHFAVEAWLINDNNELLIQQRSYECELLPGHWALTTGRITSGEDTVNGCIREVKEELGIDITSNDMRHLARFVRDENHIIWDIFLIKSNTPIHEMSLQKSEVIGAKWVSITEFKSLINQNNVFVYSEIEDIVVKIENLIAVE
ncbi:MAG: NUDIX domain-containing protein [Eubacteriales bacterium]|nr:NUDIX domain-containing protein [Eubacteriales bacterium]MDD4389659.1 NUDIX domain-containing protein [Eubacteriales bacterium]